MVKRWNSAATALLRNKIACGEISLSQGESAQYLGDIVSGVHFPDYESAPPNGRQTAIVRFCRLFRRIKLERELQGSRCVARRSNVFIWYCLLDHDCYDALNQNAYNIADDANNNEWGDDNKFVDQETGNNNDNDDDDDEEDNDNNDNEEDDDEEDKEDCQCACW